jgi:hypothetical protein
MGVMMGVDMVQTKQRIIFLALAAFLALFLGCKGESPTAPPAITTSGSGTGSGTGQPPVGASITLSATNLTPTTSSISTITATVTQNNVTVPNGTAVEFATTSPNANFTDTSDAPTTLIRTTTAGIAKATVTASTAGPVVVNVTVNNVTKSITLTFQDPVITQPPGSTAPTISAVNPATGLPTGNQSVTITGTNFRPPVRVLFTPDSASGLPAKDSFATLVTPTQINVISPGFDLGVSQQLIVSITVIVEAGAPTEQRVTKAAAFTYTAPVLTPVVRSLSPTAGPIDGGTRVTFTGDAFEAPLQVFFGSAQAQIVGSIQFHTFDVLTPAARDTNPNGSGTVVGPVDIKVVDVNSGKSVVVPAAFRYVNKMQITAISPTFGSALGGTDVTIDGTGFNDPVVVDIGGQRASVLKVTGTQILARTTPIASPCSGASGPVVVTNIDNGDSDLSKTLFTYVGVPAVITSVTPASQTVGGPLTVSVQNPGVGLLGSATISFKVNDQSAAVSPQTINNGTGSQTFTVIVPSGLTFPTVACSVNGFPGTQAGPLSASVTFTNNTTACTATAPNAVSVTPASNACVVPPTATVTSPAPTCPAPNLSPASVVALGPAMHSATINIANNGTQTLTLSAPAVVPTNATVTVSPNNATTVAGVSGSTVFSQSYTVTVDPSVAGPDGATITFTTNDPKNPTLTITVCGNGT